MFSFTASVNTAPVEEIVLSDSDGEEELQPSYPPEELETSYPPNLVFVPGNRAGMLDESEENIEPELIEEVHPMSFVVIDPPEQPDVSDNMEGPILNHLLVNGVPREGVADVASGASVPEAEAGTVPEDPTASNEPVEEVLNPFFCDFEELNRQYFGTDESQAESSSSVKRKRSRPRPSEAQKAVSRPCVPTNLQHYEREVAEAQLRAISARPGPKRSKMAHEMPKQLYPELVQELAAKKKALQEMRDIETSATQCYVSLDCLTLDMLVKNNASQSSIDYFKQHIANATVGAKIGPPKAGSNDSKRYLSSCNRANLNGKWSTSSVRAQLIANEGPFNGFEKNGDVNSIADLKSNIQAKLTQPVGSQNGINFNVNMTPEITRTKSESFDKVSPSYDLKIKTKDLRVLLKDLKTEKVIRVGNRTKPLSEILYEIDLIKAKMKDNSVPASSINVQSSNNRNQSADTGNPSITKLNSTIQARMTTGPHKPRLSVRSDLFAPSSKPVPPVISSPYFACNPGKANTGPVPPIIPPQYFVSNPVKGNATASSKTLNSNMASFRVGLKDKLSSVLTNPNKTPNNNTPWSNGTIFNATANMGHNAQFNERVSINNASAEQINAFTDQLLSFLPKTNISPTSTQKRKQAVTKVKISSVPGSLAGSNIVTPVRFGSVSSNFVKKNEQEAASGPSKASQQTESDVRDGNKSDSLDPSDDNQANPSGFLCEETGRIIDSPESAFKNNHETKSATPKSSENASSNTLNEDQDSQNQANPTGILCEETGQIIDPPELASKNIQETESATPKSSANPSSNTLNEDQDSQSVGHNSDASELLNQLDEDIQSSKDTENTSTSHDETGEIINTSKSSSKNNRKNSENLASNPPNEDQDNSDFSNLLDRLDEDIQSAKDTQSQNQDNEPGCSSAEKSQKKETPSHSANLESSPSASATLIDDESPGPSSRGECKRRSSRASSDGDNTEDQRSSSNCWAVSNVFVKKCSVVLERIPLTDEELFRRTSSSSLPQSEEEDCQTLTRNNSRVSRKKTRSTLSKVESKRRSKSSEDEENSESESPDVKEKARKKTKSKSSKVKTRSGSESSEAEENSESESSEVKDKARKKTRSKAKTRSGSESSEDEKNSESESSEVKDKARKKTRSKAKTRSGSESSEDEKNSESESPEVHEKAERETRSKSSKVKTRSGSESSEADENSESESPKVQEKARKITRSKLLKMKTRSGSESSEDEKNSESESSEVKEKARKKTRSKAKTRSGSESSEDEKNSESESPEVHEKAGKKTRSKSSKAKTRSGSESLEDGKNSESESPEVQEKTKKETSSKVSKKETRNRTESSEVEKNSESDSSVVKEKAMKKTRSKSSKVKKRSGSESSEVEEDSESESSKVMEKARKKARSKSSEAKVRSGSESSEGEENSESESPVVQEKARKKTRSKLSKAKTKSGSESSEVEEISESESSKIQGKARSRSPRAQKRRRSESSEVEASGIEVLLVRKGKRTRSRDNTDECPRKKQKSVSSSSEQITSMVFDLSDESFPALSAVYDDLLAVDGTCDIESCHEDTTINNRVIQTGVEKESWGSSYGTLAQKIFSFQDENTFNRGSFEVEAGTFDGIATCCKTVTGKSLEMNKQRTNNSVRSTLPHLQMQLFDFRSTPFNKKIPNEFHLDGNLDSETSDDEVLIEKKVRLKRKSKVSKAKSRKKASFSMKKQKNSSRNVPESSTKCSIIVSDFVVDKNIAVEPSKKSSDSEKLDDGQKISGIKSSPFDQHFKTDEKLTEQKPVIKIIRLNYDKVKDGISVFDLGRALSATSRSTSINRRKQGKPRKYGFNINSRNGGVKNPSKVISDLHFMVRNPKKRSK